MVRRPHGGCHPVALERHPQAGVRGQQWNVPEVRPREMREGEVRIRGGLPGHVLAAAVAELGAGGLGTDVTVAKRANRPRLRHASGADEMADGSGRQR